MPNTVSYSNKEIQVVFDGATAYDTGMVLRVISLEFLPAGNGSTITVRDGSSTANKVFSQTVSSTEGASDQRKGYEHGYKGRGQDMQPYVVGAEVTALSTLIIKYA